MKGTVVDEQARMHRIQLEATTEVWTPCTSVYFVERVTLRGSPSMQELIPGRSPDDAGLSIFFNPLRNVFKIVDEKAKGINRVVRCQGSNVKTYTLKMDEEPAS